MFNHYAKILWVCDTTISHKLPSFVSAKTEQRYTGGSMRHTGLLPSFAMPTLSSNSLTLSVFLPLFNNSWSMRSLEWYLIAYINNHWMEKVHHGAVCHQTSGTMFNYCQDRTDYCARIHFISVCLSLTNIYTQT